MRNGQTSSNEKLNDRLLSLRPSLTKQHRKVADFILHNGDQSCFLNAREFATATGVSPATLIRFCRELGFDGFRSLRSALREKARLRLSEKFSNTVGSLKEGESVLKRTFDQDVALIQSTRRLIRDRDFSKAATKILHANTVYLLGQKSAFAFAYFLHYRLSRLGINCKLLTFGGPVTFSEISPLRRTDVLIAIGFEQTTHEVHAVVKFAKKKKAPIIAITSSQGSPISVYADVVLYLDRGSPQTLQSMTPGFSLCQSLIRGVGARIGKLRTALLNQIDVMERERLEFARTNQKANGA